MSSFAGHVEQEAVHCLARPRSSELGEELVDPGGQCLHNPGEQLVLTRRRHPTPHLPASLLASLHTFRVMKNRTARGNNLRPSHTPHDTQPLVASVRFFTRLFTTSAATSSGGCAPSKSR